MRTLRTLVEVTLALVVLLPSVRSAQRAPGDHYLCYKASLSKGEPAFAKTPRLLVDQLQNQSFDVTAVVSLCNPATKTYNSATEPPAFPAVHQQGYQIKLPKGSAKFVASDHTVFDQFGTLRLSVKGPTSLLVRAGDSVLGTTFIGCGVDSDCSPGLACIGGSCIDPAFPIAPADDVGVDNYKCYKVAIPTGAPKFTPIQGGLVRVTDQFGGPFKVEVKKPTKLCTPVDKA